MNALIIGSGGDVDKVCLENIKVDYVICADGGLEKAEKLGMKPDVILGDFDSVDRSVLENYSHLNIKTVTFPSEKDYTDMELAVEHALQIGAKSIVMIGATGTRLDHTMANIQLLEKYHYLGIDIVIIDNNNYIKIISDNTDMEIKYKKNCFISLVPVTEKIEGLTLVGFKYPLADVVVKRGTTFLISNEIIQETGRIILKKGTALVFISND